MIMAVMVTAGCGAAQAKQGQQSAAPTVATRSLQAGSAILDSSMGPVPEHFAPAVAADKPDWLHVEIGADSLAQAAIARWQADLFVADKAASDLGPSGASQLGGYDVEVTSSASSDVATGADSTTYSPINAQSFTAKPETQAQMTAAIEGASATSNLPVQSITYFNGPGGASVPEVVVQSSDPASFYKQNPELSTTLGSDYPSWPGYLVEVVDASGAPVMISSSVPELGTGSVWVPPSEMSLLRPTGTG